MSIHVFFCVGSHVDMSGGMCRGQERAEYPMELQLQVGISCYKRILGIELGELYKSSKAISPAHRHHCKQRTFICYAKIIDEHKSQEEAQSPIINPSMRHQVF